MPPPPDPIAPEALLQHDALVRRLTRALVADEATVDDVTQLRARVPFAVPDGEGRAVVGVSLD